MEPDEDSGSEDSVDDLAEQQPRRRRQQNEDALSPTYLFRTLYNNRYYWQITKSVIIFAVALRLAHECKHIAIPMRDYEPFAYINVCTCR